MQEAQETQVQPLGWEDPLEKEMGIQYILQARVSTPVFLPGESHGQRSLAGYRPGGHKESVMTEHTHTVYICQSQSPNSSHQPLPP